MSQNPLDRQEMESLLAARQELGSGMEPALVDSFADKILAEVRRQTEMEHQKAEARTEGTGPRLTLGIVSLVMSIPLTAIALGTGFPWMAVVIWMGIVLVNFAFATKYRNER